MTDSFPENYNFDQMLNQKSLENEFYINNNSKKDMLDMLNEIFKIKKNSIQSEPEKDNMNDIYFTNYTSQNVQNFNHSKNNIFKTTNSIFNLTQLKGKKRGRPIGKSIHDAIDDKNIHSIFSEDNVKKKIKVHCFSCIINFINEILEFYKYKITFFDLDNKYKNDVKKKALESLKTKKLWEIINNKISIKFKRYDQNINSKAYDIIKNNEILKNILEEEYISFYENIYLKNLKTINLKKFGSEEEIILSQNVEMFGDLLEKNKKNGENYIKRLEYVANNFFPVKKVVENKNY